MYYLLATILVIIDQGVKFWVRSTLELGESVSFLPGIMDLTYVQNTGAAFSLFSRHTWVLTLISLVVALVLAVGLWKDWAPGRLGRGTLTLLLAGAVGNLIDRALLGYVTDMFQTTFIHFAVFNVADICVVAGGFLLILYAFLSDGEPTAAGEEDTHGAS